MLTFFVRFDRQVEEDIHCARENFGHLEHDPALQLLEQFKLELYQNEALRGYWTTLHSETIGDEPNDQQHVWVKFGGWPKSVQEFCATVQKTYDVHGMNGKWEIIDTIDTNKGLLNVA